MDISSRMVRQKIEENSDWRSLVPAGVRAIIEDKQLYSFKTEQSDTVAKWAISSEDCTQAVIQRIEAAAMEMLSTDRFLHSKNTALMASDLCRSFGFNPAAGYLAGISHDIAKQIDNKQLIKIVKKAGFSLSKLEKDKPNILHGKAGSILLRERFCIHNEDVLEAVAYHTSGRENMGLLAKVVYIADKTENSRIIDLALREMCTFKAQSVFSESDLSVLLDNILFFVLEKTVTKLKAKKYDLSEDTIRLLKMIEER
jgi:nicotinate-nucleotide adenylyltransferase